MTLWPAGVRPAVSAVLEPDPPAPLPPATPEPSVKPLAGAGSATALDIDLDELDVLAPLLHAASSRQPAIRMAPLSAPRLARTACVMHLGCAGRQRGSGGSDNRCRELPEDRAARPPGGDRPGRDPARDS